MSMNTSDKINYDDFPALFRASDKASIAAQQQFVNLTFLNLGLMLLAAISGSLTLTDTSLKTMLAIISAIFLTAAIFVAVIIRTAKLEQVWYDGRAIAESVKTMTWQYMTGCDPYSIALGFRADEVFISGLYSLLIQQKAFCAKLNNEYNREHQISGKMRLVRSLSTEERKRIYVSERIDEQRKWYGKKTEVNLKSANRLFISTIASQALAIIFAFLMVVWQASTIKLTGVFTTLAAAFMTWTQMRRNEELAQSYGLATQELNFVFEQSSEVKTEEELSSYVGNSENAISREHTMWLARRK